MSRWQLKVLRDFHRTRVNPGGKTIYRHVVLKMFSSFSASTLRLIRCYFRRRSAADVANDNFPSGV